MYDKLGEHLKAISFREKVIDIHRKTLPPNHGDLAADYISIARSYNSIGEY